MTVVAIMLGEIDCLLPFAAGTDQPNPQTYPTFFSGRADAKNENPVGVVALAAEQHLAYDP
jgi:hypothetical protein